MESRWEAGNAMRMNSIPASRSHARPSLGVQGGDAGDGKREDAERRDAESPDEGG
jgi:hypothetical protein